MRPPMHRDAEPRNPYASKPTFCQTQPTVVPALASLFEDHEDILTPMQSIPHLTGFITDTVRVLDDAGVHTDVFTPGGVKD